VLTGYNGTIMAYGQTGSGKTHTLIVRLRFAKRTNWGFWRAWLLLLLFVVHVSFLACKPRW
jgi:superfamily II DNA or RNA helicase